MKICRITTIFVPPWKGLGPGPYELSLAQHNLGDNVSVITKYTVGCSEFDKTQPFKIMRIKAKRDLYFCLKAAILFFKLNLKCRFDVIHSHGYSALFLLVLSRFKLLKTPIVSSVHIVRKAQYKAISKMELNKNVNLFIDNPNNRIDIKPEGLKNRKTLFFEKLYFKYSDALAPVNAGLVKEINQEYDIHDNIYPVLNGVNTEIFDKSVKDDFRERGSLIFVGMHNGRKGEFDLINAIKELQNRNVHVMLTIVGEGPFKQTLIKLVQLLEMNEYIEFVDNVSHSKLVDYLYKHEIFVLPSLANSFKNF